MTDPTRPKRPAPTEDEVFALLRARTTPGGNPLINALASPLANVTTQLSVLLRIDETAAACHADRLVAVRIAAALAEGGRRAPSPAPSASLEGIRPMPETPTPSAADVPAVITALIGPQAQPASDEELVEIARAVHEVREHEHQVDSVSRANLAGWLGHRMVSVLATLAQDRATIARQQQLLADAASHVTACPHPGEGYDLCAHGSWPCGETVLAWRLRRLDPDAERTRILHEVYEPLFEPDETEPDRP